MARQAAKEVKNAETRQRLLEAAGEIFAEHGFRSATVREICERANANVAAVNYHFRDKEGLYAAVFRYAHQWAMEWKKREPAVAEDASAEQKLRAFIRSYLTRVFDTGRPAWHGKLIAREMIEPTAVLDTLVNEYIRPNNERLVGIVRELIGRKADAEEVRMCLMSIMGQILYHHSCRAVTCRLYPEQKYGPAEIQRIAEHIAAFSLGALKQMRKEKGGA